MKELDDNEIHHELYIHLLWSTAQQQPLISQSLTQHLYDYFCDIALTCESHVIGGQVSNDHVQLVIKFSPDISIADLIKALKVSSMLWIRTNFLDASDFEWQKSDFAFSVDFEEVGTLIDKIKRTKSFLEEVYFLLDQNDLEYDCKEILE